MFDITIAVDKYRQYCIDKIQGLPDKPKQYNPPVKHIDGSMLEKQAEQEGIALTKAYYPHSINFGKRLCKRKGQRHTHKGTTGHRKHTFIGDII